MEIAVSFGIQKQDVERKIKNLQSHFAREMKKEAETRRTGSGADEPYVSKWFTYQAMLFLSEKNKPRNTDSSAHDEGEKKKQVEDFETGKSQDQASSQPSTSQQDQLAVVTPTKVPKTKDFKSHKTPKTKSAKRKLTDNLASSNASILDEAVKLMRSIHSRRVDSKDEYSLFG
ncbi:unnamed protein product [Psylliodes chrysocephalus]|uniref:MADF domain-containing protein n=1 Tax=Psylliodes chrysocephalus TaxID=3402493 RepID=A0A9P0GBS9_9CUCU|nr:unnamed protein product [Psylliodes chrysocephala]